jgi:hypothetical protein
MRWLAATIVLLGVSAALVAGIYLRDRDSSWQPPQRAAADFDAHWVLNYVAGPTCGKRCSYAVLANPRADHWLARIVDRSRAECVDINVRTFDVSGAHGIVGIRLVDCDSVPAPSAG